MDSEDAVGCASCAANERAPHCNLCGSTEFLTQGVRRSARCAGCDAQERTRVLKMMLDRRGLPKSGQRILHLAPERGLAAFLSGAGAGYDPVDLRPKRYPHTKVRRFDLTTDAEALESRTYDLIVHSHVMEHIPCDVTAVLFHLHRALKDDGLHLCCIPILPNRTYASDFGPIDPERATREFGQKDHVRRFGSLDLTRTLGMVFRIPAEYDVERELGSAALIAHNVPEAAWRGWTPHSVLALGKRDLKLNGP